VRDSLREAGVKVKRTIIVIDEEKCDGCGLCIPSCSEGALRIIDTAAGPRARLVRESLCDGLGACLGHCPQGALRILEVEEAASLRPAAEEEHACPSAAARQWRAGEQDPGGSMLGQWPIQLHLVSPEAPFFKGADVLLVADCVPFVCRNFHVDFLQGKAVAVACPKLDDTGPYLEKLIEIIRKGKPRSLTVLYMQVPCCGGLLAIASRAAAASGGNVALRGVMIGLRGEILKDWPVEAQAGAGPRPGRPGRRIPRGSA